MTCDKFDIIWQYMPYGEDEYKIVYEDGDIKGQFRIYESSLSDVIHENLPYFSDIIAKEMKECAECAAEDEKITDEEKRIFLEVLEKVRP